MKSKELETVLEILRSRLVSAEPPSLEESRATCERFWTNLTPLAEDVRCEVVDVGGIPAEWITTPEAMEERVIYYLHGGGYVMCSINTHKEMISRLARAAGARALAINYRLAPENPFPAAVEDATAAYRWVLSTGVNPARVVIAGDSAGGGLAVATLVALRDAGDPLPAAGICISPWVDMEALGGSVVTTGRVDPVGPKAKGGEEAKTYLGGADPRTPLASPGYADLRGLPPLLSQVGTAELLVYDSIWLAVRAKSAGVDVSLELWQEMIHGWLLFAYILPEGQQAIERIGEFVREHTGEGHV